MRVQEAFRTQFKRTLRLKLRQGFSVERSFGRVWEQTQEAVNLDEAEQSLLFGELIAWAKELLPARL